MTLRSAAAAVISLLALSACAAAPGGSATQTAAQTTTPEESPLTSPEPTPTRSLSPSSNQPSRAPSGTDDEVTGVLGADSIEGGCGYLRTADGTRYQVVYPDGWRLQLSPLQLTSPEGQVVARGGDEVTVRGSVASDMASTCQIGPIFRASEVVSP